MNPYLLSAPCSCPSEAQLIGAALAGTDLVPSCIAHEADAMAAAAEAERIAAIVEPAQDLAVALETVRARFAAEQEEALADHQHAQREQKLTELSAIDPFAGHLARILGAPMSDVSAAMPLNASADSIASMLGMSS